MVSVGVEITVGVVADTVILGQVVTENGTIVCV